jgi:hypothetical protein
MKVTARLGPKGPPPPGERLFLDDMDRTGEDFSGRRLHTLSTANSTFRNCRFERMRVEVASLGVRSYPSWFVECSFDGSRMKLIGSSARFERCTFRDVDIRKWVTYSTEIVDCVFSGKLRDAVFHGTVIDDELRRKLGRERNEFHGNDFTGCTVLDVAFRTGIDLTHQRFPVDDDLVYLPDAAATLAAVVDEVATWPAGDPRDFANDLLESLGKDARRGQRQLLIRESNWVKRGLREDAYRRVFALLRAAR